MFPYLRVLGFLFTIVLLYVFWEWGAARTLVDTVHPSASVSAQLIGKPMPQVKVNKSKVWSDRASAAASKQEFLMSELRGQPVIVHFWATWCGPCLQELPELIAKAKELRGRGFRVVAVAVDEDWGKLDDFFRRYPALADLPHQAILLLDPGGEIAAKFGSSRFPETFLINTEGLIDNKLVGAQPWGDPQIEPYLQRLRATEKAQ